MRAKQFGIEVENFDTKEKIADNIFKKICRPKIIQPTFVIDYPVGANPLAKRNEANPEIINRFQLIIGGLEIINGFSELNDPIDQRKRFGEQDRLKERGKKAFPERRRLFGSTGIRHAASRGPGPGHRPPGNASHQHPKHPRSNFISDLKTKISLKFRK